MVCEATKDDGLWDRLDGSMRDVLGGDWQTYMWMKEWDGWHRFTQDVFMSSQQERDRAILLTCSQAVAIAKDQDDFKFPDDKTNIAQLGIGAPRIIRRIVYEGTNK